MYSAGVSAINGSSDIGMLTGLPFRLIQTDCDIFTILMPVSNGIFYETQSGGLCRLHAVNAFCGAKSLTPSDFQDYIAEFDAQTAERYGEKTSCAAFDMINSDQNNLVSFILKKNRHYVRYIPIGRMSPAEVADCLACLDGDFIFAFDARHIWGIRRTDRWYVVDSMRGVSLISSVHRYMAKPLGFMVPVDMRSELTYRVDKILDIFEAEGVRSKEGILKYLRVLNDRNQIMEDLEVHMSVAIDILDAQSSTRWSPAFIPIYNLIALHRRFMKEFIAKKYAIDVIERFVPTIVFDLLVLVKGRFAITGADDEFI